MTLNGHTYVTLTGGINITNQSLTVNSTNQYNEDIYVSDGTNSWRANFNLSGACSVNVLTNASLTLNLVSSLAGAGSLVKYSPGSLTLSGPANVSSFTGDTTVKQGALWLNSTNVIRHGILTIGSGSGTPQSVMVRCLSSSGIYGGVGGPAVVLLKDGGLDLNGFSDGVGPITMDGATISTGAGTLSLYPPLTVIASANGASTFNGHCQLLTNSTLTVSNVLSLNAGITSAGNFVLTKTGPQYLFLNASNAYTGTNIFQQGWVSIANGSALGSSGNSTIVSNGATLTMSGNFTVTQAMLTLNGPGASGWGALDSKTTGGTNIWVGPITLAADSTFSPDQPGTTLRLIGPISGPGGFSMFNDSPDTNSVLSLEGSSGNTYAGTTTVSSGTLMLNKTSGYAVPGNLFIDGAGVARLAGTGQSSGTADVLINGGGLFDFATYFTYVDTLHGSGQANFGVGGWIQIGQNNGSSEFDGTFTGTGYASGYTVGKTGSGTFTIGGNSSYTAGITHLLAGKTVINGSQPKIPVTVDAGATLGGTGRIGIVTANGNITPGNSVGILNSSNVVFSSTGNLMIALNGTNAGTGYSQLNVTGTVSLASATLQLVAGAAGAVNSHYTIISNDVAEAVSGTFAGLAEGASVVANNGVKYTISYHGGTGNDVVLTQTNLPASPILAGLQPLAGGAIRVTGTGITNLAYTVWANTNLAGTNWISLGSATVPANTNKLQFTDANATNYAMRYYRFSWP